MKKLYRILIVVSIALLFVSCIKKSTTAGAKEKLSAHLYEKYGEEFEIEYIGKRSDGKEVWYEAEIYPKKYNGTVRENNKYYHRKGFVDVKKGIMGEELGDAGDTYAYVKLNESASEFYKEKLEELFGENYLSIFDIYSYYIESDFKKLIKNEKKFKRAQIKGGIYIFGRVENDKDREWFMNIMKSIN